MVHVNEGLKKSVNIYAAKADPDLFPYDFTYRESK
ncbi:hypothetical protein HNQ91_002321 [Filimonas zeae]|nr:hypothetical protein [Filimonas zeae]